MFQEIIGSNMDVQACDCHEKCFVYCQGACTYCGGEYPNVTVKLGERADNNATISALAEI